MKYRLLVLIFAAFAIMACGGNKSQDKDPEEVLNDLEKSLEESFDKKGETQKFKDCDDFLDGYEKWVDDYLVFLEAYMKNPMDAELLEKYTKVLQEAATWSTDWTNLAKCSAQEKYEKRFDEINEKMEKKMKELGLD